MTLNEIASNVRNILRGGRSSNDDIISLDQIKYLVKYYRALLIRRDQQRNLNISNEFQQTLQDVPISADKTEFNASVFTGNIYKTDIKIPVPLRLKNKEAISTVILDDDFGTHIPVLDYTRVGYQQYNKYTSAQSYCLYKGGYLYISNNDETAPTTVTITGIFEDPIEVFNATDDGFDEYDDNSEYPVSADMVEAITKSIISGEGSMLLQAPNDNELDKDSQ